MLIFAGREGESLRIGDAVQVTVLVIGGNQVYLGVCAPDETPVHREEVYERLQEEKELRQAPAVESAETRTGTTACARPARRRVLCEAAADGVSRRGLRCNRVGAAEKPPARHL